MTAHFMSVMRQAFKTFDRTNSHSLSANLAVLRQLTDQLTYRDLQLSKDELFCDTNSDVANIGAPCTYMHIFENETLSMSVFIIRRGGYTMPLHDHPMMHGLLRGIWGQMRVQSYTQDLDAEAELVYEKNPTKINVTAEEPCLVSAETQSALLTPRLRNFHQITAVNGVAAFFDILSPPYDADMPIYGPRRCRVYRPKMDGNQLQLECIPAPVTYYCDIVDTPDEVLQCSFVCASEACNTSASEMQ